jgi:transcriptional regulator with XRE-family HTH domain
MLIYSIDNKRFFIHDGEIKKRLPLKQVAELGNVSIKTVYKWLNGTQTPTQSTVELIQIKAFGLILGLPDWRFIDGLLWCDGYNRPFPPHSLHIMAMLTQWQNQADRNRTQDAARIAALEAELLTLRHQFHLLEQVAPRDFTDPNPLPAGFHRQSQGKRH